MHDIPVPVPGEVRAPVSAMVAKSITYRRLLTLQGVVTAPGTSRISLATCVNLFAL